MKMDGPSVWGWDVHVPFFLECFRACRLFIQGLLPVFDRLIEQMSWAGHMIAHFRFDPRPRNLFMSWYQKLRIRTQPSSWGSVTDSRSQSLVIWIGQSESKSYQKSVERKAALMNDSFVIFTSLFFCHY